MMANPKGYTRNHVLVHWIIVLLVAGQYILHGGIESAWEQRLDGSVPNAPFPNPHAIVGMVVLGLTLWRLVLRVRNGAPALPDAEPKGLQLLAGLVHVAFYVLLLAMPVSGAVAWIAGIEVPALAHAFASNVMLGLVAVHVVGAFVQTAWLKSDAMQRMSPRRIFADRSEDV